MSTHLLCAGQQAKKEAARRALPTWLFLGLLVLVPARASGQTTFSEAQPVETPPLHDLAVADLDSDGDPDLVAITADGEDADALVWFENDGAGQFAAAQTLLTNLPREARSLKTADLDGDGDPDLLVGNDALFGASGLFWAANEGGHLGALEVIEPVESGPFIAVDFDGDGDLDVLQGGLYVGFYENTGGGSTRFRRAHALAPGPAGALAAADFDGDGDTDVLASHRSFTSNNDLVFNFEQREPGTLRLDFRRRLPAFPSGNNRVISVIEAVDMNGDGKRDVVLGAYLNSDVGPAAGELRWYRNSSFRDLPVFTSGGTIAYQESVFDIWGPMALTIGDFDGDGDNDVAFAKVSHDPDSLVWYENPGEDAGVQATWSVHVVGVISTGIIESSQAVDIDLDGDVDLVSFALTWEGERVVWYENLGPTGTVTEEAHGEAALVPASLKLEAVWPNPSSGAVTVAYQVRQAGRVRLEVFDVLGRLVATYEQRPQRAGSYRAELNLGALAAGTYVLRLQTERQEVATRRIVLQ